MTGLLLGGLALSACSVGARNSDWSLTGRAPREAPQRFQRDTAAASTPRGTDPAALPAQGCWVRLVDPRDGTRLTLVQSSAALGDYTVEPAGRYGVGPDERLRVDCTTGRAVGIVPRDE